MPTAGTLYLPCIFPVSRGADGGHSDFEPSARVDFRKRGSSGRQSPPSLSGRYAELLRHSQEHAALWDPERTQHTPEQTGISCFFHNRWGDLGRSAGNTSMAPCPTPWLGEAGSWLDTCQVGAAHLAVLSALRHRQRRARARLRAPLRLHQTAGRPAVRRDRGARAGGASDSKPYPSTPTRPQP